MPIDFLKIAGSLIRNLSTDVLTRTSLKAIIDLAKSMDKQTIAKFVEQAEDLGILWNLGFDYVQGNYFQQADAHTDYEFADETTLSSDASFRSSPPISKYAYPYRWVSIFPCVPFPDP